MATCIKCGKVFNEWEGFEDKSGNTCCSKKCAGVYESDNVSHPSRYNQGGIEFWDVERAFFGLDSHVDHLVQSALEYGVRFRRKNGAEDLRKAANLLTTAANLMEGK